nr:TIGR00366 family protein [Acinetobacter sp. Marseille-Q1620]
MNKITNFFTQLMQKYLPDPFVFAIGLTLLTMILAVVIEGYSPVDTLSSWGDGFWSLLAFTTQMAVILCMGYVLAASEVVDNFLNKIVSHVHRPQTAIIVATLVGCIGCYLNWGFGLVVGSIIARKLATQVKGVHYPLIIAAAYSGFTMYGLGFSATIPVLISTPGHVFEKQMGIVPLTDTIFSVPLLLITLTVLITLPLLNAWLHPKNKDEVKEINISLMPTMNTVKTSQDNEPQTFASRLNNSRLLSFCIGILGLFYIAIYFIQDGALDLNKVNFIILFLGILFLKTPANYVAKLNEGIKTIGGIVLQFPFYAGIMAIMDKSGLVSTISEVFVNVANAHTLPFWGLVSSFVINFFAPSGGGHWALQGPFMIQAATELHSSMAITAMSVMLGNAWNDLVQPFWILPALALSQLKLKDIMGYSVIAMFWVGIIYIVGIFVWSYLYI